MKVGELPIPESVKEVVIKSGITELYPPQEEAVRAGALEGRNLVLASPTASGKTLIAELCALKHILERDGKVLYLTPLRALASEKYHEFKKYTNIRKGYGRRISVGISTGDFDSSDSWLERHDIIISTNEKCDSLLRHRTRWMDEISLIVADEVHLLNDGERGPTLEVVLARLMQVNPDAQLLALSATVKNAEEAAEWLKAGSVTTEWRPVVLREGVLLQEEVHFKDGDALKIEKRSRNPAINLALHTIRSGGQALIFASTRKNSVSLAKKAAGEVTNLLSKPMKRSLTRVAEEVLATGERTRISELLAELIRRGSAFHHAGLGGAHRRIIEDAFREGKIKVLTATPTLAFGVNLPARMVVVHDYRRYEPGYGYYPIAVLEYKQMCLPYDAPILLADGTYVKIGKVVEGKEDAELVTLNEITHELQSGSVVRKTKRLAKEVVKIEVQHGEQVKVTSNHLILTKDGWKRACDIRVVDSIAHVTKIPYEEKIPRLKELLPDNAYVIDDEKLFSRLVQEILTKRGITKKAIAEVVNANYKTFLGWANSSRKNVVPFHTFMRIADTASHVDIAKHIGKVKTPYGKPVALSKLLTEDFFWLAGLIATDGNLNRDGGTIHIRIFNTDEGIVTRVRNLLGKLGLKYRLSKEYNRHEIEFSNLLLGKIFTRFGVPTGKKSNKLYISSVIKSAPKPLLSAFLSGIFDGDGNYTEVEAGSMIRMIRITTKSKRFAHDLKEVFLKLGVVSHIKSKYISKGTKIRGKEARFKGKAYYVVIRSIMDIKAFFKCIHPTKRTKYDSDTTYYKIRSGEKRKRSHHVTWSKVIKKETTVYDTPIPVYNVTVNENANYVCCNLVLHNCGRAGRPQYDKIGEALLISKTEDERDYLMERFVFAEPERIWSKLAVERILRSHVLATVAADFAHTEQGIYDFFGKTFYAYQYDPRAIKGVITRILKFLYDEKMIEMSGENVYATRFGRRVSELYIDPVSAVMIREALLSRADRLTDISFLHVIAHTPDMFPKLRPYSREMDELALFVDEHREEFMFDVPDEWEDRIAYEEFLGEAKLAWVLDAWIEETSEDETIEKFRVQPGDLYRLIETARWLLYASHELAALFGHKDLLHHLAGLMERVEKGVKAELLPLVRLKGIGRVRGRVLYDAGLKSLADLKRAPLEKLTNLPHIGPKLAKKIKEQVGGFVRAEDWEKLKKGETWEQQALTEY